MLEKTPKPDAAFGADLNAIVNAGAKNGRRRRWLVAAVAVVVALAGGWYWMSSGTSSGGTVYSTAPVTRGALTVQVTATGTVEPTNEVEVSSELSGTVRSVSADYNDEVSKGEVLAKLDTEKLDANVAVSEATVAARTADVKQADVTASETAAALKRASTLLAKQAITQETFDSAQAASDRAEAALATAKANLSTAEANLTISRNDRAKAEITSPVDGVVLARDVEVGQTVAASLSAPVLFTLAEDLAKMQLEVDIDEADMGKVAVGDRATFTVAAYSDRTFPAAITQIRFAPETVEGVVTYKAILSVDNSDLVLRPGMTATADIVVEEVKDTLLVPNAALRFQPPATAARRQRGGGAGLLGLILPRPPGSRRSDGLGTTTTTEPAEGVRRIFVLRDGHPVPVSVTAGPTDGSHTAVTGGDLKEGDKVIVSARTAQS